MTTTYIQALPAGTPFNRTVGQLASESMSSLLLKFYAATGEHTKRLTSVRCNTKFWSLGSGPEDLDLTLQALPGQDDGFARCAMPL